MAPPTPSPTILYFTLAIPSLKNTSAPNGPTTRVNVTGINPPSEKTGRQGNKGTREQGERNLPVSPCPCPLVVLSCGRERRERRVGRVHEEVQQAEMVLRILDHEVPDPSVDRVPDALAELSRSCRLRLAPDQAVGRDYARAELVERV